MLTFEEAQKQVDDWVKTYTDGYWPQTEQGSQLIEEAVELQRELRHLYGRKKKKDDDSKASILEELGDVLMPLICVANQEGICLEDAFARLMEKCHGRDAERFRKTK